MSDKFVDVVEGALEGMGKGAAVLGIVDPAARAIAKEMGAVLQKQGTEDPRDFFNDDPEHNRAVMRGVALANEINSTIDWASVPADVLKIAWIALKAAAAIRAVL